MQAVRAMYEKILLTLDGSELARSAIAHAAGLAADGNREVVVLEVIEPMESVRNRVRGYTWELSTGTHSVEDLADAMYSGQREEARRHVEEAKAALECAGVRAVSTAVVEGLPGNAIIEEAERRGCDAIVMATRGHSGLGREVLGSVAEYVLRHVGPAAVVLVGPRAARPLLGASAADGASR